MHMVRKEEVGGPASSSDACRAIEWGLQEREMIQHAQTCWPRHHKEARFTGSPEINKDEAYNNKRHITWQKDRQRAPANNNKHSSSAVQ